MGCKATKKKTGMGNEKNIRKVLERLNGLGLQTNSSIPFLKAAKMTLKAMLFSKFQTSKKEFSAKTVNSVKFLTIFPKCSFLVI